jgi:exosortase/archaeosortase family protein
MVMDSKATFLAKFFALFLILQAIVLVVDLNWLQNAIAAGISSQSGTEYAGKFVNVKEGVFEITPSCTGLVSAAILAAVVFSLKKPGLKNKTALFLAGTAILFVLNYFRVLLVVVAGRDFGIGVAEILHVVSWFVMSAGIIIVWYWFTKKITKTESFEGFL